MGTLNKDYFHHLIPHPVPTPFFTGRDSHLQQLIQIFNSTQTCTSILITGIGGIGKSEIAKEFLSRIKLSKQQITWINAAHLTSKVIQGMDKALPETIELSPSPQTVIVFDEVTKFGPDFRKVISALKQHFVGLIIMTTTQNQAQFQADVVLEVEGWTREEVKNYVSSTLRSQQDPKDIEELTYILSGVPLAIQQAVCYILTQQRTYLQGVSYGVCHFLEEYKLQGVVLLKDPLFLETYTKTMVTVWEPELEAVKTSHGKLAFAILQVFGILNVIQMTREKFLFFLETICSSELNIKSSFEQAVKMLCAQHWLVKKGDHQILTMHKLRLDFIRYRMMSSRNSHGTEMELLVAKLLNGLKFEKISNNEIPDILYIWEIWASLAIQKCHDFLFKFFSKLIHLQFYGQATSFAKRNSELFSNLCGRYDARTTAMKVNFAIALIHSKEADQGVKLCEVIFNDKSVLLNSVVFQTIQKLFQLFAEKGLSQEVTWLGKLVFPRLLQSSPDNLTHVLELGVMIGKLSKKVGQFNDACNFYDGLIDFIKTSNCTDWDLLVLKLRHKRAVCLNEMGLCEEAVKELEELVKMKTLILGKAHIDTLKSRFELIKSQLDRKLNPDLEQVKILDDFLILSQSALGKNNKLVRKIKAKIEDIKISNEFVIVDKEIFT